MLTLDSGVLTYVAGEHVANHLTVGVVNHNYGFSDYRFTDSAETIIAPNIPGCTGSTTHTVTVPIAAVSSMAVTLGDEADFFTLVSSRATVSVDGGEGADQMWFGGTSTSVLPDDIAVVLQPVENNYTFANRFISLQKGGVIEYDTMAGSTQLDVGASAVATVTPGNGMTQVFDLVRGQARKYDPASHDWSAVTADGVHMSTLVGYLGKLYALADNGVGSQTVYQYSGAGTAWTAVTDTATRVETLVAAEGRMYLLADVGTLSQSIRTYTGFGTSWTTVSFVPAAPISIASSRGVLYALIDGDLHQRTIYRHTSSGWEDIHAYHRSPIKLVVSGDRLFALAQVMEGSAAIPTRNHEVSEYDGPHDWWSRITWNVNVSSLVADAEGLYMLSLGDSPSSQLTVSRYSGLGLTWVTISDADPWATDLVTVDGKLFMMRRGQGHPAVYHYNVADHAWQAITGSNTNVTSLYESNDELFMVASNNGGSFDTWKYSGSGTVWSKVSA
jgi:hypothetical protein